MSFWAIADLHLHFATPEKAMSRFGEIWKDHHLLLKAFWEKEIKEEDYILLAGDLSWANSLEMAKEDLDWIGHLPGKKIIIEGNHDYWWSSYTKMEKSLPSTMIPLADKAFCIGDVAIVGTRMWDNPEFFYYPPGNEEDQKKRDQIFYRQLARLERALATIPLHASKRIAMTHYPPVGANMEGDIIHKLYLKYGIDVALFGHLHQSHESWPAFGMRDGVFYQLISFDYLKGKPLCLDQFLKH